MHDLQEDLNLIFDLGLWNRPDDDDFSTTGSEWPLEIDDICIKDK